jgi:hypothetical protein
VLLSVIVSSWPLAAISIRNVFHMCMRGAEDEGAFLCLRAPLKDCFHRWRMLAISLIDQSRRPLESEA